MASLTQDRVCAIHQTYGIISTFDYMVSVKYEQTWRRSMDDVNASLYPGVGG